MLNLSFRDTIKHNIIPHSRFVHYPKKELKLRLHFAIYHRNTGLVGDNHVASVYRNRHIHYSSTHGLHKGISSLLSHVALCMRTFPGDGGVDFTFFEWCKMVWMSRTFKFSLCKLQVWSIPQAPGSEAGNVHRSKTKLINILEMCR